MDILQAIRIELRELDDPFFTDEEIQYYIMKNKGDYRNIMHELCMLKAENDSLKLPGGLTIADNSEYWKNLAKKFRRVGTL